jgi:hypothetical protein
VTENAEFVRVIYVASEDGYQELWFVECDQHGSVSLHGDGRESWLAMRAHEASHNGRSAP